MLSLDPTHGHLAILIVTFEIDLIGTKKVTPSLDVDLLISLVLNRMI